MLSAINISLLPSEGRAFRHISQHSRTIKVKMSNEEFLYHSGICPNCPTDTAQRFLFAAHESSGRIFEAGRAFLEGKVETFSMFRCGGCGAILFFKTFLEDVVDVDNPILFNPEWILDLDSDEFKHSSTLIHSTLKKQLLHPSVPEHVRRCYEIAIRVKPISNDLYALQLRKTLEAVCKDKGASEYLPNGKRAMLWQLIDELEEKKWWDVLFPQLLRT